jgi:hypothetical protein
MKLLTYYTCIGLLKGQEKMPQDLWPSCSKRSWFGCLVATEQVESIFWGKIEDSGWLLYNPKGGPCNPCLSNKDEWNNSCSWLEQLQKHPKQRQGIGPSNIVLLVALLNFMFLLLSYSFYHKPRLPEGGAVVKLGGVVKLHWEKLDHIIYPLGKRWWWTLKNWRFRRVKISIFSSMPPVEKQELVFTIGKT